MSVFFTVCRSSQLLYISDVTKMEQLPIDLVFFFGGGWASANFLQRGKGESYGGGGRGRETLDFNLFQCFKALTIFYKCFLLARMLFVLLSTWRTPQPRFQLKYYSEMTVSDSQHNSHFYLKLINYSS